MKDTTDAICKLKKNVCHGQIDYDNIKYNELRLSGVTENSNPSWMVYDEELVILANNTLPIIWLITVLSEIYSDFVDSDPFHYIDSNLCYYGLCKTIGITANEFIDIDGSLTQEKEFFLTAIGRVNEIFKNYIPSLPVTKPKNSTCMYQLEISTRTRTNLPEVSNI
jgi:hypothetical protein